MRIQKTIAIAMAVALANGAIAIPSLAEDSSNKDSDWQLEKIVVTATKRETYLMDTPVAITALDQATMERQGVKNIKGIASLVPNLDISQDNSQSTPIISMRGVRSINTTELGDPAVSIHMDGVYSPRMQGALAMMFDTERVEVLRGPQGTLFGRNSSAGSINIISKNPVIGKFEASINAELGRWNSKEFHGVVNIPVSDTFALRVSAKSRERDSYIDVYYDPNQWDQRYLPAGVTDAPVIGGAGDGVGDSRTQHSNWWIGWADGGNEIRTLTKADPSDSYGNIDEHSYRIAALWEPTDKWSVKANYQKYVNNSAGDIDLVNCDKLQGRPTRDADGNVTGTDDCSNIFPGDDNYQAVVNVPGRLRLDIDNFRGRVDYVLTDYVYLVWIFGYEEQARESTTDMDGSLNAWDQAMFFLDGTGSKSYSNEIQLQSNDTDGYTWIVGANMFHEKTTTKAYLDNSINDKEFWDLANRTSDSWAVFAQGTYDLTDKLNLTLGTRYSFEEKQDVGGTTYTCTNDNSCVPGWWERDALNVLPTNYYEDPSIYPESSPNDNYGDWSNTDWRISLDYKLNEVTMLYASIATGFKSGGIGDVFHETNPRTGEVINVKTAFDSETVTTFELGFKTSLFENTLNLTGTYFFSNYEDMQYASVGNIAYTDRGRYQWNDDGTLVVDGSGAPVFDWETAPIVAFYTQNVPGAEIQGIELEFDWAPYPNGRFSGFATWTKSEIVDDWITKWDYDPISYFGIPSMLAIDPENEMLITNLKGNELAVTPSFELNVNYEHTFSLAGGDTIKPWINIGWEDESYLTLWNVDKHTDDLDFAIADEDIKYTDDKRDSHVTVNASLKYTAPEEKWYAEAFVYNLTNEGVQYWGGVAEGVAKGSMSQPRFYGLRVGYNFQ
ncbi:MAG: TonB-dependent receptor [Pseudomonadales bacterium]